MNVEVALISKIIRTGDFVIVTDMAINGTFFSGLNRKAFLFIRKHQLEYGQVPSEQVFKKKFPAFKLLPEEELGESLRYYCDEVRRKKKHNTIVDFMEEATEHIEDLETEKAYELIRKLVVKVENEVILTDRKEINKNTRERLDDYLQRQRMQGMTGIPSGIDRLDYILKGYNGGELIALLGYTGTGKTWFEIIQAVYQAKQGYKVLLFTTEMSTKMMIRRVDAVWCKLSYTRFRDGKLTPKEFKRYQEYLEKIEGDTDANLIVEQATGGVSQIGAKIDQHKPDIVIIDGAYLLEDEEKGEDDWRALIRIFRGLHRLALQKNVPIIASTQSKERRVSLETISFAKQISNDCDVVMAIEQDDEMKQDKEIKVKFLKIREGSIPGNIMMEWDFDQMKYGTIYIEGHDGNKVEDGFKGKDSESSAEEDEEVLSGVQILE